jgi:asparagine synthase (glutamine-hydrolysing)
MPGIVGIIGTGATSERESALRPMVQTMMHETFYRSGAVTEPRLNVASGWVARAGSFADGMPLWNRTKDVCLIFAGEDFPERLALTRLSSRFGPLNQEDPQYLVHLYEDLGDAFFATLNGWFAGVVIDLRQNKVILFNDRYGLHRVYYSDNEAGFYFASEAKALLKALPQHRRLNDESLGEYFSCGCPLRGRALFSGMSILPPASVWSFTPGKQPVRRCYFDLTEWRRQERLGVEESYERLRETFARIVPKYLRGREKVGVSLTGGVDSRMFMAWSSARPGSLPCYTFGGMYRDSIDVKVARRIAGLCGQPHHVLTVGEEFLRQFPKLVEQTVYLTDGAMDPGGTPDLYVNRLARELAPVRLTGNYGGEVLRSLVAFKPMSLDATMVSGDLSRLMARGVDVYRAELESRKLSFVVGKQVPWHHYSRLSLEATQLTLRSPYLDNELVALAFQMPESVASDNSHSLRLISDGNAALGRLATDRGVFHRKVPVLSQLQNWWQEFTFKAEYAYDYGMPQKLVKADNAVRMLHLERLFLGRHKFYHCRYWYRTALAGYVKEVLLDPQTLGRPYLNRTRVEEIVRRHTSGTGNHTLEIHRLLATELIQRRLIGMS